jgi:hypothetical protein
VQASRLKPQVKSALVETEEFKAVINFYLKEQNPNFPGSSDAINTMEERYAARIALMQRDEYHWGLLQTEGSLIDWALLALWVGNLRRYKSPPKGVPLSAGRGCRPIHSRTCSTNDHLVLGT